MSAITPLPTQPRVLHLYRKLLKIGKAMPTETRSALVLSRVKGDFRANAKEQDPEEIESMIQLADLQVDNMEVLPRFFFKKSLNTACRSDTLTD